MLPRAVWHRSVLSCLRAIPTQPGALSLCRLCEFLPAGSRPVPECVLPLPSHHQHLIFKRYNKNEIASIWGRLWDEELMFPVEYSVSWQSLFHGVGSQDISGAVAKYSLTRRVILLLPKSVFLPPHMPASLMWWWWTTLSHLPCRHCIKTNEIAPAHMLERRKPGLFTTDKSLV